MDIPEAAEVRGRKREILGLLARRPRMSVGQLASALGLTPGGVRQQLAQLESAGTIIHEPGAGGRGRFFYSLAPISAAAEHAAYHRFVLRLLHEIESEAPGVVDRAVTGLCIEPTEEALATVTAHERVAAVATMLEEQGFAARVEPLEGGRVSLRLQACPVESLAREFELICDAEEQCILRWLKGFTVERDHWLLNGAAGCSYTVE